MYYNEEEIKLTISFPDSTVIDCEHYVEQLPYQIVKSKKGTPDYEITNKLSIGWDHEWIENSEGFKQIK